MIRTRGDSGSCTPAPSEETRPLAWCWFAEAELLIEVPWHSCARPFWSGGQFEGERGAFAQTFAMDQQCATHFAGGQCPAVQAEPVPVWARGEAVREHAGEILRGDAYAIIGHRDAEPVVLTELHSEGQSPFLGRRSGQGVFGVADEIDEDLHDFVLVQEQIWHVVKLTDYAHSVTVQGGGMHAQGVLNQ